MVHHAVNIKVIQKLKIQNGGEGKGNLGCEGFRPYCSQLRPCCQQYHWYLHIKKLPSIQKFYEDEEVKNEVATWLCAHVAEVCDIRIQKLIPRLNMYLDKSGDHVEK
jgi:hypothetical protein